MAKRLYKAVIGENKADEEKRDEMEERDKKE